MVDKERYSELVEALSGLDIRLRKMDMELFRENLGEQAVDIQMDTKIAEYSPESITIDVFFSIESTSVGDSSEAGFKLSFVYRLKYTLDKELDLTNEILEEFANRNTPINVWPYAREFVSSTTSRMGLTPLILSPLQVNR